MQRVIIRCRAFVLSIIALLILMPKTASAGVEMTWPGAEGGTIQALIIDPNTNTILYASTNGGGVFKSTNGGDSWSPINDGLTSLNVQALAIDPVTTTTLYAGTAGEGFFKLTEEAVR